MTPPPPTPLLTLPDVVAAIPALLPGDYRGVRSGRVRDLPDVRTIRFYQSTGLVDRPTEFRGRAALYGRRHLLQIAAIKKLQAAGLSLGDIQRGLPGKTDAEMARSLGVTLEQVDGVIAAAVAARGAIASAGFESAMKPARRDGPFWKARPAGRLAAATVAPAPAPAAAAWIPRAAPVLGLTAAAAPLAVSTAAIQSLDVGGGVVVLWNGRPLTREESAAVGAVAAPLVALLAATSPAGGPAPPVDRPSKPAPVTPEPVTPAPLKKEKRR